MSGDGRRTGIYLPDDDGVPMTKVERFLDRREESGYFLADASGRVPVPPELAQVIRTAVTIFQDYDAVEVLPKSRTLAAEAAVDKGQDPITP